MRILAFGTGWIGTRAVSALPAVLLSPADITHPLAVSEAIARHRPTHVLNCAGRTGRPNVDALERDPIGTWRSNVLGPAVLASRCAGLHLTHLSSGCLYQGARDGTGWREEDPPGFNGSLYARTKAEAEQILLAQGALVLRLRMPLSAEPHPRNLLTKLLGYREISCAENSVTILEDFFPIARALMERKARGIFHVVNPGVERHDRLLELAAGIWNRPVAIRRAKPQRMRQILVAERSDCVLSTAKLRAEGLEPPALEHRLPDLLRAYDQAQRALAAAAPAPSAPS